MRDIAAQGAIDVGMLREEFSQWLITGAEGCWFAIRSGLEMHTGPHSLLRCTLGAPTLAGLTRKLCLQTYLDGLDAEELEDVWRRTRLRVLETPEECQEAGA